MDTRVKIFEEKIFKKEQTFSEFMEETMNEAYSMIIKDETLSSLKNKIDNFLKEKFRKNFYKNLYHCELLLSKRNLLIQIFDENNRKIKYIIGDDLI